MPNTPHANETIVVTDGACLGNPGPGGWATIIALGDHVLERAGYSDQTTNNRMELLAVIEGLAALVKMKTPTGRIRVITDSSYVADGASKNLHLWKRRDWKTVSGTPVLNRDLWERMDAVMQGLTITWQIVRGHRGIPSNERVNTLATQVAEHGGTSHVHLYDGKRDQYTVSFEIPTVGDPYYISLVDGKVERHKTWDECQKRVHGRPGAKTKKIHSNLEELTILTQWKAK